MSQGREFRDVQSTICVFLQTPNVVSSDLEELFELASRTVHVDGSWGFALVQSPKKVQVWTRASLAGEGQNGMSSMWSNNLGIP